MKKYKFFLLLCLSFALFSCSKSIDPIEYGHDACDFCSMTIVGNSHAAQLVTSKGKNFKFDASECLINYLEKEQNESDMLHLLSSNYLNPGEMLNALEASFIISENIPSPMGGFLSALASKEEAEQLKDEFGGEVYNWTEVKKVISTQATYH